MSNLSPEVRREDLDWHFEFWLGCMHRCEQNATREETRLEAVRARSGRTYVRPVSSALLSEYRTGAAQAQTRLANIENSRQANGEHCCHGHHIYVRCKSCSKIDSSYKHRRSGLFPVLRAKNGNHSYACSKVWVAVQVKLLRIFGWIVARTTHS